MVVITDITVPADQFALGQLFETFPDVTVELERLVPLRDGVLPLFWVSGADAEAVEETIRADPLATEVEVLTAVDDQYLFDVVWSDEVDSLVDPLVETDADVLRATGSADRWSFRLQFRDRDDVVAFTNRCQENDLHVDLQTLYDPTTGDVDADTDDLTDEQHAILTAAYQRGYWAVPRGVTLRELADGEGISPNAASQRMRRGLATVVGQSLDLEPGRPT